MTSWNRLSMTIETISIIRAHTKSPYELTVFDNGSDIDNKTILFELHKKGYIDNLIFMGANTGCLYNKFIYHAMTVSDEPYYIVTDNDVLPPDLGDKCWLKEMTNIMNEHPELGMLALQLPPQQLQEPYGVSEDNKVFYCKAVGNTFKMIRRSALELVLTSIAKPNNLLGEYGDDSLFSKLLDGFGFKVGFTADMWCLHTGQCENWGYKPEEVAQDPRKSGYGKPFTYNYDPSTYEPTSDHLKIKIYDQQ